MTKAKPAAQNTQAQKKKRLSSALKANLARRKAATAGKK